MNKKNLYLNEPLNLKPGSAMWPKSLPTALFEGYSITLGEGNVYTPMSLGPARVRRVQHNAPKQYSQSFLLDREQLKIFTEYYKNDLKGGVYAAVVRISDEDGYPYIYAQIQGVPTVKQVTLRGHFKVSIVVVEVGRP